jgi:preprotein translocase subunit SecA
MVKFGAIARKLFGSSNDRRIRAYKPTVDAINALEAELSALSDAELAARTTQFRDQIAGGAKIDDLIVPAFATVREAARRTTGLRPFVQLIGGMVLHEGKIAEMKTGEGKTLVATLPVYLNALKARACMSSRSTIIWPAAMPPGWAKVYGFLGLTTGTIVHGLTDEERRAAYACDVTYATNNELGFDYLRDNMKVSPPKWPSARTTLPLSMRSIHSGRRGAHAAHHFRPAGRQIRALHGIDALVPQLEDDYEIDEKQRTANFSEQGSESLEDDPGRSRPHRRGHQPLRHREHSGRPPHEPGAARPSAVPARQGLHRAQRRSRHHRRVHRPYDAGPPLLRWPPSGAGSQRNVAINPENQTLASVTFQNYFRLYDKLAA